jgi:hypothetical protein
MAIAEIEAGLPWGLHDAILEAISVDWPKAKVTLTLRLKVTERQDFDRRGEIEVGGLVFCAIDPPEIDVARGYNPVPDKGLWVDAGEGAANEDAKCRLPSIPIGCFLHWIFVRDWNRFIHLCGRRATFRWLEPKPVKVASRGALDPKLGEYVAADPIQDIVGHDLGAVTFLRDYVQLHFDGPSMNVLTPVTVRSGAIATRSSDESFRNAICRQISKSVASVRVDHEDALTITFTDDSTVSISLRVEESVGPEAVIVHGSGSRWAVL